MNQLYIDRFLFSAIALLVFFIIAHLLKRFAKQTQIKYGIKQSRYFALRRLISSSALLASLVAILVIWNVNVKNAWVSLTGILTITAVAFFAVWSLVGNILAGVLLYFTSPFKIEDVIMVMPEEIKGKVLAINTFYTVLQDDDKNYINIPNSMFFQKFIKVIKNTDVQEKLPDSHNDGQSQ